MTDIVVYRIANFEKSERYTVDFFRDYYAEWLNKLDEYGVRYAIRVENRQRFYDVNTLFILSVDDFGEVLWRMIDGPMVSIIHPIKKSWWKFW